MAFPVEFNYENEDQFIQRLLIPLLQRLGFSLVVNYHGQAEFGKDLVFAEIDRFGHVRYHGLQAKYEASISLNEVDSLIRDCRQAFSNPFSHPQTGATERISSFYAVNGGSLGHQALEHYFNSLLPMFGANARLLQGKDLVTLDRWAAVNRTENVISTINGMMLELRFNREHVTPRWNRSLQQRISGTQEVISWPVSRYKTDALSAYLMHPALQSFLDTASIVQYWETVCACNRLFDMFMPGQPIFKNFDEVLAQCLAHLAWLEGCSVSLETMLKHVLETVGPLSAS